jgi:type II secretory pathway pseudopilin PulG
MLAVIAIIGILTSIAMPNLSGAREKARDSERVTELNQIALALEHYYNSCKQFPPSPLTLTASDGCPAGSGITLVTFLDSIPKDPLDPTRVYTYETDSDSYVLQAQLERNNSALTDDLDGTVLTVECDEVEADEEFYYCIGG